MLKPIPVQTDERWLDTVVTARQVLADLNKRLGQLSLLRSKYTCDDYPTYNEHVEDAFNRDGVQFRLDALRRRAGALTEELTCAERNGYEVVDLAHELREVIKAVAETDEATRVLVDEAVAATQ